MKWLANMSQENFNRMMNSIVIVVLAAMMIWSLPGALDQWWSEEYEQHSEK